MMCIVLALTGKSIAACYGEVNVRGAGSTMRTTDYRDVMKLVFEGKLQAVAEAGFCARKYGEPQAKPALVFCEKLYEGYNRHTFTFVKSEIVFGSNVLPSRKEIARWQPW
jgi:hypothetical protein